MKRRLAAPRNAPGHVGCQGRNVLVDILPIQVHARFQAQGIAGAQADRRNTGAHQIVEKPGAWSAVLVMNSRPLPQAGTGDKPITVGLAFEGLELMNQGAAGRVTSSAIFCRAWGP